MNQSTIFALSKGVNCHVLPSRKFKTVSICIVLRRPLSREEAAINAVLAGVLKQGGASRGFPALNRRLDEMGGAVFDAGVVKKGEEQLIQLFLDVEPRFLSRGAAFLSEIVLGPLERGAFPDDLAEREKLNIRNAIKDLRNDKAEYAKIRCLEEMCKNEPFGVSALGDGRALDALDSAALYRHYLRVLEVSPIEIMVLGEVLPERCARLWSEFFMPRLAKIRRRVIKIPKPLPSKGGAETSSVSESIGGAQAKICIGFKSGIGGAAPDFYPLLLMNEVFGQGPASRLFSAARERESLCYSIQAYVYRFKGILFVECGADADSLRAVSEITKDALRSIARSGVSEYEFSLAQKGLIKRFSAISDYPGALLDFYLTQYMLGLGENAAAFTSKLSQVRAGDLSEAASRLKLDTVYLCA
ncbi:MAG: insulinase family protein [Clostridiales bacterium]|jgi:predicted Zn-dependent peptidase|nr:insulinase family protein [Clostridiales bacterium]